MKRYIKAVVLGLVLLAGISSCGKSAKQLREENAARRLGRAQALELSESMPLDTIEIEKLLIEVRTREAELRRRGHSEIADVYLNAFLAALDSVNPSLSDELR